MKQSSLAQLCTGSMLALGALACVASVSTMPVSAASEITDSVSLTISNRCEVSRTAGSGNYSTTLASGSTDAPIGSSTFKIVCNDAGGWELFAVGAGSDPNSVASLYNAPSGLSIPTGTSGEGSFWNMTITPVSGTYTPTILYGSSAANIPTTATKIAYYSSPTDSSTGSSLTVNYKATVSATQPATTYSGKVTYRIEHPYVPPEPCKGKIAMQDITASYIASMTTNTQVQMCDKRDEKMYWVAKLADGRVWMTQNLDLVLSTSTTLTPSDSNVSANWTPNINTQTTQYKESGGTTHSEALWDSGYNTTAHSYRPASDAAAGTSGKYGTDSGTYFSPVIMTNGTTMSSYKSEAECVAGGYTAEQCAHWNVGTFYSWYAATAGTGNAGVSTAINVTDSICPKGWHLPSAATSSSEFRALKEALKSTITGSPYYFLRAGLYAGDYGAVYNTDVYGFYWSRTSYSNSSTAYGLGFSSSSVGQAYYGARYYGMNVRCIADY